MKDLKKCSNCIYFNEHYIILGGTLKKLNYAQCLLKNKLAKNPCEKFLFIDFNAIEKKAIKINDVRNILDIISKTIDEIRMILELSQ